MLKTFLALAISLASLPGVAIAQDIRAGKRVTVNSDWHAKHGGPYSPKVVACKSSSGLCLHDTSFSPPDIPMEKSKGGYQVVFKSYGVIYLFRPKGKGTFHDMKGKKTGTFEWSQ